MATGHLIIDLDAIAANWHALDALSAPTTETAAVVKANAYGLGMDKIAPALLTAGVKSFFVATAEEGAELRNTIGDKAAIAVLSGHMENDHALIRHNQLIPCLNSVQQIIRHFETLPACPFIIQLDTGMNRLGLEPIEWQSVAEDIRAKDPLLIMSHLACADDPHHPQNDEQIKTFVELTHLYQTPLSLAATAGLLLGDAYHFDLTRPGIGLYGSALFKQARPVVQLDLPVIQTRFLNPKESVGYGATWCAERPTKLATLNIGYADGLFRALSNKIHFFAANNTACPLVGRVSMDLVTVDITDLEYTPDYLSLFGPDQSIDTLAQSANTISYEILTNLGQRYTRHYKTDS